MLSHSPFEQVKSRPSLIHSLYPQQNSYMSLMLIPVNSSEFFTVFQPSTAVVLGHDDHSLNWGERVANIYKYKQLAQVPALNVAQVGNIPTQFPTLLKSFITRYFGLSFSSKSNVLIVYRPTNCHIVETSFMLSPLHFQFTYYALQIKANFIMVKERRGTHRQKVGRRVG